MSKNYSKAKSGFTIIEVVLVLAIAGLIFLMVFLALPALQRSQRDTQRRDDLSGFSTRITDYQSNNRGKVPATDKEWKSFFEQYMKQAPSYGETDGEFVDPDGEAYLFEACGATSASSSFNWGSTCNGLTYDTISKSYSIAGNVDFKGNEHKIRIVPGGKCDGEKIVNATGSKRQLAFLYKLEGGGVYCGSNS